jgi:predicted transcriptional regulator of viral defense system
MLEENEMDIFNLSELKDMVDDTFSDVNELVENLVPKKILSRIERGKYCRSNFRNENVIGTFVARESAIAYWSALNAHGLTEQFSNTIFVQTTFPKKNKTVFGTKYQFVRIAENKRCGIEKLGYGNHSYSITDVEKTIVDCFDLPQYSGGYAELIIAFNKAKLKPSKMIEYCEAVDNIAVIKRTGFLAEFLEKPGMKSFVNYAKTKVNPKYNLFDAQGGDAGEFIADWKLRLNISKQEIGGIIDKQY